MTESSMLGGQMFPFIVHFYLVVPQNILADGGHIFSNKKLLALHHFWPITDCMHRLCIYYTIDLTNHRIFIIFVCWNVFNYIYMRHAYYAIYVISKIR